MSGTGAYQRHNEDKHERNGQQTALPTWVHGRTNNATGWRTFWKLVLAKMGQELMQETRSSKRSHGRRRVTRASVPCVFSVDDASIDCLLHCRVDTIARRW